jgi:hypothetical protein
MILLMKNRLCDTDHPNTEFWLAEWVWWCSKIKFCSFYIQVNFVCCEIIVHRIFSLIDDIEKLITAVPLLEPHLRPLIQPLEDSCEAYPVGSQVGSGNILLVDCVVMLLSFIAGKLFAWKTLYLTLFWETICLTRK